MAKQLREMLTDLRAEIGHSTNVAHGINDRETLLYYLNRTQIQLYQDYDWPQLMIFRGQDMHEGQRFYPYPVDLAFDDISQVFVTINDSNFAAYLAYGIGPEEFTVGNSDAGYTAWPTRKWQHSADDNMIDVWPVPDSTPGIRLFLRGTRTITTMVNDADLATLPDNLIVLFSAVEILQRDSAKDAAIKLQKANEAMRRHRVRQFSHKHRYPTVIGGGGGDAQSYGYAPAIGLDYIPPGYGSG